MVKLSYTNILQVNPTMHEQNVNRRIADMRRRVKSLQGNLKDDPKLIPILSILQDMIDTIEALASDLYKFTKK